LGPEAYVVEPEELRWVIQADLERSLDQYREGKVYQVKETDERLMEKGK